MAARTGTRALRLVDAEGTAYWLEYRTATGRDAWLGRADDNRYRLETGVLLRRTAAFPDSSVLLDGSPSSAAGWDADLQAALPVGVPVELSGGDFTVTVRSLADGGAALSVVPGVPAATAVPPAPRDSGAGRLLAGAAAGRAGGVAAPAADAPAADTVAVTLPAAAPAELPLTPAPAEVQPAAASLDPASGSAPTGTLLVALAGAGLAGATLLVVRRARRLRTR